MCKKQSLQTPAFTLTNQASLKDLTVKQLRCMTSMKSVDNLLVAENSPSTNRECESIGLVNGPSSVHVQPVEGDMGVIETEFSSYSQ